MISTLPRAALAAALALAACDYTGDDIIIEPEFVEAFSFEDGLEEWTPRSALAGAPSATAGVARTTEHASQGAASVALVLDAPTGQGSVWIERRFDVEPEQAYIVDVTFDLGGSDAPGSEPWTLLAGATPLASADAGALSPRGDTGGGTGEGVVWLAQDFQVRVTSSEDGEVWVHTGVSASSAGRRTYYVDAVSVVFTRDTPLP